MIIITAPYCRGAHGARGAALLAGCLGPILLLQPATAASRITHPSPGGIDPRPVILSVSNYPGGVRITGAGYQGGPFQVVTSTNTSGGWAPVGPEFTNNVFTADFPADGDAGLFRLTGPMPNYGGAVEGGLACGQCHSLQNGGTRPWDTWFDSWQQTPHASAFKNLVAHNAAYATNTTCLQCHTTAFGYPGGYTPGKTALEDVQCESCHGPAGVRHRVPGEERPAIQWSSMVCGGCHTGERYGTYDQWKTSAHAETTPDVAQSFLNPTTGTNSMFRCGPCHSGAMRAYMMVPAGHMPDAVEAGQEGIVCVGCHDPHKQTAYGNQLRNPLFSTNTFSLTPATNWNSFAAQYKEDVNLCGQCHNARGAAWTDTSRPPHHSPQYNLMIGAVGAMPDGAAPYQPGGHALLITNQCAGCHMQTAPYGGPGHPTVTGHAFEVTSLETCRACHPLPELLVEFTSTAITTQIQQIKASLDQWASSKAPEALRTKYGARAWEYTNPGALSLPEGTTGSGPTTAEQAQIPDNIKKARFNLYLVQHDGSKGIHNGPFAVKLLDGARQFVQAELNK